MATATQNKIRIRLKAYDHSAIEAAAKEREGKNEKKEGAKECKTQK